MNFTGLIIILLSAAVVYSGCTSPSAHSVPVTPSAALAEYHSSGGIAGINEYLTIYENGTAVILTKKRNTTIILNQSEINEINDLLRQAPVISQNETPRYPKGSADTMYISVNYRGNKVKAPDQAYGKLVEILNRVPDT